MRLQTEEIEIDFSTPATPFQETSKGQARIDELLEMLPDTFSKPRRIYLLQEAARRYLEDLDQPEAAMVVLQAALQEDIHYAPVIDALSAIAERTGSWSELLADLVHEAEALVTIDCVAARELWLRVATWYLDPLGDVANAQRALDRALALAPQSDQGLELQALVHVKSGAWTDALAVWDELRTYPLEEERLVELLVVSGDVARQNLQDDDRALNYYRMAQDLDATCIRALDELETMYRDADATASLCRVLWKKSKLQSAPERRIWLELEVASLLDADDETISHAKRIYERLESPEHVVHLMTERATQAPVEERSRLHYQIARLHMHLQRTDDTIEWHLQEALSHNWDNDAAITMLLAHYSRRALWGKAATVYETQAQRSTDRRTKVRALVNAARIYHEQLNHPGQAANLCRDARAKVPTLGPAAKILAEIHFERQEWSELEPLAQELLTNDAIVEPTQLARLHLMMGTCAHQRNDYESAFNHFAWSLQHVPQDSTTLLALGELCFDTESWTNVVEAYEQRLRHAAKFRSPAQKAEVLYQLGEAQRHLGDADAALTQFEAALNLMPRHRGALAAQTELYAERGNWRIVANAKRNRLQTAADDVKAMLLADLGDIEIDELRSPERALIAYQEALELKPDDHRVMQRILDLAAKMQRWSLAYDVILRFAALESDSIRQGQYYLAAAEVCRDRLGARSKAAEHYTQSLDAFFAKQEDFDESALPRYMKAFADLDAMLTSEKAWKQQEIAYRQMIKRLPPGHALIPSLWTSLAEIYRSRLRTPASAIAALEVVTTLAPHDVVRREQLAELYVLSGPDSLDKAIAEHQAIIDIDSNCHASYSALADLYAQTGQQDAHWNLCQALVPLGIATVEQQAFAEAHHTTFTGIPRNQLPASLWPKLIHPSEDPTVSSLLLLLAPALLAKTDRGARSYGLKSKELLGADANADKRLHVLSFSAKVLGLEAPTVYLQSSNPYRLRAHVLASKGVLTPALSVGAEFHDIAGTNDQAFVAGQALCSLRQEHWISRVFEGSEPLQEIMNWSMGRESDAASLGLDELKFENPVVLEQLRSIAQRLRASSNVVDAGAWLDGQRATCDRAGLLMCGDLSAAARSVARDGRGDTVPRLTELLRFSTSESYFTLRRALVQG